MKTHPALAIGLVTALGLGACGDKIRVQGPQGADLAGEAVRIDGAGPPPGPDGTCWAQDLIPAIYETTTDQRLLDPEVRDAAGKVISPATYQTDSRLRVVAERRDIWFKTPCEANMTPDFLASLQRALKARGYYDLPLSGEMDAATAEALRRYQAELGLDSAKLSLGAARDLGLIAAAPGDPEGGG